MRFAMLAVLVCVSAMFAYSARAPERSGVVAACEDEDGDEEGAEDGARAGLGAEDPWDLEGAPAVFHPAMRAFERSEYDEAKKLLEEVAKTQKYSQRGKDPEKDQHGFLLTLVKELAACQKLLAKNQISAKEFEEVRGMTWKNRETFIYPRFQAIEDSLRIRVGIGVLATFEPDVRAYEPLRKGVDFFKPYAHKVRGEEMAIFSTTTIESRQGRYALQYEDSKAKKDLVFNFPVPQELKGDWLKKYRYLCFFAKLSNPNQCTFEVTAVVNEPRNHNFLLKCGSWEGWKQHRIDFKKIGISSERDQNLVLTWKEVHAVRFGVEGGVSDYWLDDIYLSN